jgi:hypothetical protein
VRFRLRWTGDNAASGADTASRSRGQHYIPFNLAVNSSSIIRVAIAVTEAGFLRQPPDFFCILVADLSVRSQWLSNE